MGHEWKSDPNWWLAEPLERKGEGHKFKIGDFIEFHGGIGRVVNYTPTWQTKKNEHFYIINWLTLPHCKTPGLWRESYLKGAKINKTMQVLYGQK